MTHILIFDGYQPDVLDLFQHKFSCSQANGYTIVELYSDEDLNLVRLLDIKCSILSGAPGISRDNVSKVIKYAGSGQ